VSRVDAWGESRPRERDTPGLLARLSQAQATGSCALRQRRLAASALNPSVRHGIHSQSPVMRFHHAFVPRVPFEDPGEPFGMVPWQNAHVCGRFTYLTGHHAAVTSAEL